MRKLLPLLSLFICVTILSCENEPIGNDIFNEDATTNPTNPSDPTDPNDPADPTDPTDPTTQPEGFSFVGEWELVEFNADVNTLVTSTDLPLPPIESDILVSSTTVSYTIIFTETDFTASGDYSYDVEGTAAGQPLPAEEYTLTDVSGFGDYAVDGNEITVDGQFFELTFEGAIDTAACDEPQTFTFSVSNDGNTVTFNGNQTITDNQFGVETVATTISTSVIQRVN